MVGVRMCQDYMVDVSGCTIVVTNVLYQLLPIVSIAAVYDVYPVEAVSVMSNCDCIATVLVAGFDKVYFDKVCHFTRSDHFSWRVGELKEVPLHDMTDMTSCSPCTRATHAAKTYCSSKNPA